MNGRRARLVPATASIAITGSRRRATAPPGTKPRHAFSVERAVARPFSEAGLAAQTPSRSP